MSARALQLREGVAPTRDRLTTTVFMAALVHGVIIVGVTFGSTGRDHQGAPGLEVLIVSEDVPAALKNDDATYLAQRTQLGSGNAKDADARSPRAASEHSANNGRVDGTALVDDAGALMSTADSRVLTTSAPQPDILYFAPPASLTESPEVPVLAEGNSSRDRMGLDDADEQRVRGPKRVSFDRSRPWSRSIPCIASSSACGSSAVSISMQALTNGGWRSSPQGGVA